MCLPVKSPAAESISRTGPPASLSTSVCWRRSRGSRECQRSGAVNNVPLSGNNGKSAATVKGYVRPPGETLRGHYSYGVDGDYFAAMGFSPAGRAIPLRGRFTPDDRVCVVDEDFARFYWPHASALGQRLFEGSDETKDADAFTVVGVVGAVKQAGLTDDAAQGAIYYPYALRTDDSLFVVLRTSLPPESLGRPCKRLSGRSTREQP